MSASVGARKHPLFLHPAKTGLKSRFLLWKSDAQILSAKYALS
jgi:hypothetical protein